MKYVVRESVWFFLIGLLGAIWLGLKIDLPTFYRDNLQGHLFAGFLGLGGFLLSLKTFIVVKLHEGIFKSDVYQKRYETSKAMFPEKTKPYYEPLKNLSSFLVWSVGASLVTAMAQLSIGYLDHILAVSVCIGLAVLSIWLVLRSWWEIKGNLKTWFKLLEEEREESEKDN